MRNRKNDKNGDNNKLTERNKRRFVLIGTFVMLYVTKAITIATGNVYIGGLGVVLALAVAAAFITEMIGKRIRKRKESE
ncbi:hypothetical protein P4159_09830 [Bacillus thuringiensis]|uniref:hypothetical protein n=1 Tax=Bacillus thuringiensis TaxID=1428 RepID=UPI0007C1BFA4|nr:hypothetical protein [Bacillus thuringiensis]AND10426.1 hypothetical protein Bt4C1_25525 [Bacillus thuringiensis serovar alesti]MEC3596274.1 hypothetical protein [Bacillus thuringiensis]MED1832117.1 hypothetical protein [Bacillus thuringiensis]MED2208091.1 hypothetical protein [Bacillus thuringiensis]MED2668387.1 hypothetical protein [Bacillus thuringiensis]